MAIIKMRPPRCGKMIELSYLLGYIMDDVKTEKTLVFAQNCNVDSAYAEMILTKEIWNKTGGRQYCHIIQSFDLKDNISAETAHEIGKQLIQEFPQFDGFEIVMATHKDKHHLHNHYAINSVNSVTGYKWEQRARDLYVLKECSNKLSTNKEYMQAESNRKHELDSFLNILDELLEIYCEYNFGNPEQEAVYCETEDEEEWEL